jgi:hypothetical protein
MQVLLYGTDVSVKARVELEDLAMPRLAYELDPACDRRRLTDQDLFYISDDYKREVLRPQCNKIFA